MSLFSKLLIFVISLSLLSSSFFAVLTSAFVGPVLPSSYHSKQQHQQRREQHVQKLIKYSLLSSICMVQENEDGSVGDGRNWIEKSFPVGVDGEKISPKKVEDYDLGINGKDFQTGSLSERMYNAIVSKSSFQVMSKEIEQAFQLYAMDFTAKEAVRAALQQNGLELVLKEEENDEGVWGDVDTIRLLDKTTEKPLEQVYDNFEEALPDWTPGQGFDFVVRQVPAKMKELSVDEILQALDPDGALRKERGDGKQKISDEEMLSAIFDDSEDIDDVSELAQENNRRINKVPKDATSSNFIGDGSKGYNVINRSDLLLGAKGGSGNENKKVLMHVMNALVSHGVLLVDVSNGGKTPINNEENNMLKIAQDVVRIATTASSLEHGSFPDSDSLASEASTKLVNELLQINDDTVATIEAHTDVSFVTIVPMAAEPPSFEVFDEEAEKWYQPELKAKEHYDQQKHDNNNNSENEATPWQSNYVAVLPGTLLQLVTRMEIPSVVYRAIASNNIIIQQVAGKRNAKLDTDLYLGGGNGNPLTEYCHDMTMDEIEKELKQESSANLFQ